MTNRKKTANTETDRDQDAVGPGRPDPAGDVLTTVPVGKTTRAAVATRTVPPRAATPDPGAATGTLSARTESRGAATGSPAVATETRAVIGSRGAGTGSRPASPGAGPGRRWRTRSKTTGTSVPGKGRITDVKGPRRRTLTPTANTGWFFVIVLFNVFYLQRICESIVLNF